MNTITSFSRNNQYQMKNNQVHSNVQFQGLNVRMLTPKGRKIQRGIMEHHSDIAHHLGQNVETIVEITKGASLKKLSLLDRLSSRAIAVTYKHPEKIKEVGDHAVNIFKNIKKPSKTQVYLISHGHGSFETMDRVFEAAHNNPKRFKFAERVNREVLDTRNPKHSEMTAELLESKNSDKYVEDFDSYKSYLILNRKDENVVKNLDKMVESGQYNARKYAAIHPAANPTIAITLPRPNSTGFKKILFSRSAVSSIWPSAHIYPNSPTTTRPASIRNRNRTGFFLTSLSANS